MEFGKTDLLQKVQAKIAETQTEFEKIAPSIRQEYGYWLQDFEVQAVISAKRYNAVCDDCTGTCKRLNKCERGYKKVVEVGEDWQGLFIKSEPCQFYKRFQMRRRIQNNFKQSKIPERYVGKRFDSYEVTRDNESAVDWAKHAIENPNQSLMFYGLPGCGKTHLAAIIAQEDLRRGRSVIFGDVPSLLDDLKSSFDRKEDDSTLDEKMRAIMAVDVLVLDDIGTEYSTPWALERLYMIINGRYNVNKPIIATSNYNAEGLKARLKNFYGERIVSRLSEMCEPILISGKDRRYRM